MVSSRGVARKGLGDGFHDHGDALAAADAGAGNSIAAAATTKFEQQREDEARSGGAERMAERDGAAVDVGFVAVKAKKLFDGEILRSESFVHFDQVDLIELQVRECKSFLDRRNRPDAHDARRDADRGPRDDPAERLPATLFRHLRVSENDGGGSIDDAAGVTGGDDAVLANAGGSESRVCMVVSGRR